jgi:hypothetical protein
MENRSRSQNTAARARKRGSRQSAVHTQWLAGYAVAKAQAAALARLYQDELIKMATDDVMLDPARDGHVSPEDVARSAELEEAMWQKASAAHTAEDIAGAIDSMQPSVGNGGRCPPAKTSG